jgi:hypothetical protein
MDNDLKKLINETINETYAAAPEKLVERGIREIQYDICPHCKKQINEYEEYTEDGGTSWRHRHCKGLITRPETPLEQINRSFQPYVVESRRERHAARKALGMENVIQGACPEDATEPTSLPVGGHKKYDKQQPEGPMSAVNTSGLEESDEKTEKDEQQPIAAQDYVKFMDGSVRVVNTTHIPITVAISEFTSNVNGAIAKSYIVHIQEGGSSK